MSQWYEADSEDIVLDLEHQEVEILVTANDMGNIYVTLTFDQIKIINNKIMTLVKKKISVLPCPFCGREDISVVRGSTFRWRYAMCNSCGAQAGKVRVQTLGDGTPDEWEKKAEQSAFDEWNTRY